MRTRLLVVIAVLLLSACAAGEQETLSQVDKADTIALEAALRNAVTAEESYFATSGSYAPDAATLGQNGMNVDPSITLTVVSADATGYCIEAVKRGIDTTWHVSKAEGAPAEGAC